MKQGRPKDPSKAKNRIISIVLTEPAYKVYMEQCHLRSRMGRTQPGKWIHKFVSDEILIKFSKGKEAVLLQDLLEAQERMKKAEIELRRVATQLSIHRDETAFKEQKPQKFPTPEQTPDPIPV